MGVSLIILSAGHRDLKFPSILACLIGIATNAFIHRQTVEKLVGEYKFFCSLLGTK